MMAGRPHDENLTTTLDGGSAASAPLRTVWKEDPVDPAWDRFVASHPMGHHTQSALWSQVKSSAGWMTARLVLQRGDTIVGGAQLLHRRFAWHVGAGYLAKGPLLAPGEESRLPDVLQEVEDHARRLHLRHLTIQPADENVGPLAPARSYLPGSAEVTPPATVLIDLDRPLDEILGGMSAKTRYNIRLSARKGITVREGSGDDLDSYYGIYLQTAERQGFEPSSRSYFRRLWEVLGPGGHVRLALAELDGEPLSAQLAVVFGDSVVNKMSVWSGREGPRRPNEALQWNTIEWAHGAGFAGYDLEGLPRKVAETVRDTGQLPDNHRQSVSSYKLGFGGRVVVFPPPFDFLPDPALRWAYGHLVGRVDRRRIKRLVQSVRVRNR